MCVNGLHLVTLLLSVYSIGSVHSEVTLPGPCPEVPVPANFSWKKIEGTWYVIKALSNANGEFDYCPVDQYIFRDDSTVTYLNQFAIEGYLRGQGGPGLVDPSQPNKITIKFTPDGSSLERYVVDSDYETYVAMFGCKETGTNHQVYAKVLSRNLTAPTESRLAAYIALENLGVPATSLINIEWDEYCPTANVVIR